jgi:hypothetical protein
MTMPTDAPQGPPPESPESVPIPLHDKNIFNDIRELLDMIKFERFLVARA